MKTHTQTHREFTRGQAHRRFTGGQAHRRSTCGQAMTEYLILLLLVALVSIGAVRSIGSTLKQKLQLAERHIEKVQLGP